MFASLFALLYVAHLLSDYPFQTDTQASRKAGWTEGEEDPHPGRHHHGWGANLVHAGTHVLTTAVALGIGVLALDLPLSLPAAAIALLWIGSTHSLIDRRWPVLRWMEKTGQKEFIKHGGAAHVDQAAHITALALAALAMAGTS
ncbi:DUF3307 domain-containing protein [Streptomyces albus]|uniref:DUF3307 domain-containing protein n=1 Tax=Streptomyces albus TaxID=1888 RepID=UPI0033F196C6